jgi:hypothetical protein
MRVALPGDERFMAVRHAWLVSAAVPSIRVRDMAKALAFYLGPLEFKLKRGGVSAAIYIESSDLAGFQARLKAAGARIIDPLAERPWGQSEFTVEDHEGNWLAFWQASSTG